MQATTTTKALKEGLLTVLKPGRRTNRKGDENVMLDALHGQLVLRRSYDDDYAKIGANSIVPEAKIGRKGSVTLDAADLARIVRAFPAGDLDLSIHEDAEAMLIEGGAFSVNVKRAADGVEVLTVDIGEEGVIAKFDAKPFAGLMRRVNASVGRDAARPILADVRMELDERRATFVSADGFRLASESMPWGPPLGQDPSEHGAVIPHTAIDMMMRRLKRPSGEVEVHVDRHRGALIPDETSSFTFDYTSAGTYPDWRQLVPEFGEDDCTMSFGVDGFAAMTRLLRALNVNIVRLATEGDALEGHRSLVVTADPGDIFGGFRCDLEGSADNQGRVALNERFLSGLSDTLRHASKLDQREIVGMTMDVDEPQKPVLVKVDELPTFRQVIMPMYVQWSAPVK